MRSNVDIVVDERSGNKKDILSSTVTWKWKPKRWWLSLIVFCLLCTIGSDILARLNQPEGAKTGFMITTMTCFLILCTIKDRGWKIPTRILFVIGAGFTYFILTFSISFAIIKTAFPVFDNLAVREICLISALPVIIWAMSRSTFFVKLLRTSKNGKIKAEYNDFNKYLLSNKHLYEGTEVIYREGRGFSKVRISKIRTSGWGVEIIVNLIPTPGLLNSRPPVGYVSSAWECFYFDKERWGNPYLSMAIYFEKELVNAIVEFCANLPSEYTLEHFNAITDLLSDYMHNKKIQALLNNPKATANELTEAISENQDLCDRLIRLVNSEYYGFPHEISTVQAAIVLLGFDAVKNIIDSNSRL